MAYNIEFSWFSSIFIVVTLLAHSFFSLARSLLQFRVVRMCWKTSQHKWRKKELFCYRMTLMMMVKWRYEVAAKSCWCVASNKKKGFVCFSNIMYTISLYARGGFCVVIWNVISFKRQHGTTPKCIPFIYSKRK